MRVYIAGPDVFRPDAQSWAESVRTLLARHGHQALIPLDGEEVTAAGIYRNNLELIRSADAILANLNPFAAMSLIRAPALRWAWLSRRANP